MLGEAVDWLFSFISVVTLRVVVGVLLLDHFSLLVVEQLQGLIVVCQPRVLENLLDSQSLMRVDLEEATEHVSGFLRNVILESINSSKD